MSRLFVGNFDFEHELAAASGWNPSAAIRRMLAERAVSWIALADDGDLIWTPEPIADEFWESLAQQGLPRVRGVVELSSVVEAAQEVVPWGLSAWTRAMSDATEWPSDWAVRQGNSREWSFSIEQELGVALPGVARIERLDDFSEAVRRSASEWSEPIADHAWVIKANFGMAARERLLGRGLNLASAQQSWLTRRIAADRVVFFEPWLRPRAEVGIQWTLPPFGSGVPKLEGLTPLMCDSQGGYRGSEFSLGTNIPREWRQAVEVCEQAVKRLQGLGYFGPLGIDAAIYEDTAGQVHVRPLQDINARFTMGRLALGFRRFLKAGEHGVWRHGRRDKLDLRQPSGVRREYHLTPEFVGNHSPSFGSHLSIEQI